MEFDGIDERFEIIEVIAKLFFYLAIAFSIYHLSFCIAFCYLVILAFINGKMDKCNDK